MSDELPTRRAPPIDERDVDSLMAGLTTAARSRKGKSLMLVAMAISAWRLACSRRFKSAMCGAVMAALRSRR